MVLFIKKATFVAFNCLGSKNNNDNLVMYYVKTRLSKVHQNDVSLFYKQL